MEIERIIAEGKLHDIARLEKAYGDWLEQLLQSTLWSPDYSEGTRIPWNKANEARKHSSMQAAFATPGLYLFGSAAGVPLYLGMTTQSLWKRLSGRYLRGQRSQCELAVRYGAELKQQGIDGLPQDIRHWYRKSFGTSTVRLQGAAVFARHGIEGIWVALLPVQKKEIIKSLEALLIPIANRWNGNHGYELFINKHIEGAHSVLVSDVVREILGS